MEDIGDDDGLERDEAEADTSEALFNEWIGVVEQTESLALDGAASIDDRWRRILRYVHSAPHNFARGFSKRTSSETGFDTTNFCKALVPSMPSLHGWLS